MKIIGIGGLPRSGKDTLAEVFIENGYYGVSLGDMVRNVARTRHADKPDPISVANMTETSNWLRVNKGPDFAIKEAERVFNEASKEKEYKGLVVFSVRMPIEVQAILSMGGEVIWVETDDQIRLERAHTHLREGEQKLTLEEQRAQEALQSQPQPGLPPEVQMNTEYVKANATIIIENNENNVEAFKSQAKATLQKLLV